MPVAIKRVYEEPVLTDGPRVLVDRLWPRGVTKDAAHIDHWLKDLAPSDGLRKWYHLSENWELFKKRYFKELCTPEASAALEMLYALIEQNPQVTLIISSRILERNDAAALKELVDVSWKPPSSSGPAKAATVPSRAAKRRSS